MAVSRRASDTLVPGRRDEPGRAYTFGGARRQVSASRLPVAAGGRIVSQNTARCERGADDGAADEDVDLFDGDDVDEGESAPEDEDFAEAELAGIKASQEDPETAPADDPEAS
jgi:hypothetical protein